MPTPDYLFHGPASRIRTAAAAGMGRAPVTYRADADGVGWIVFDDDNARANIFNPASLAALSDAVAEVERSRPKAVVIASGKPRIFIAGADLKWLMALPDAAAARDLSRQGQALFQRVADLPIPVVCAIHGACAGGGFELALACEWRVVSDATCTQIGLPETSIGTIPGWGGTVRLPRLIGAKPALDHILAGKLIGAAEARRAGLVDQVVPESELQTAAKQAALKLATEGRPPASVAAAAVPALFAAARKSVSARPAGAQPAAMAAIDAIEGGTALPVASALELEATLFSQVTSGAVCKNLIHVFFLQDAAKKRSFQGWFGPVPAAPIAPPSLLRIGVVGAGVMGSGIAQWLATRGFNLVLRDVDAAALHRAAGVIDGLFEGAIARGRLSAGEAAGARARIATTTTWDGFQDCDFVIEAVVEDIAAKQRLFSELERVVRPDAVLASNTSALPIQEMVKSLAHPERTLGIHFFNPVSRMALVELIIGEATSAPTAERALQLVKSAGKSPIICRSSPGFLVTRVLFFYLNAAVRRFEQGETIGAIDGALRDFGWPMGPLRLIDEVGVDVTDFIFGELAHYFPRRFAGTTTTKRMLAAGLRGRKNGASRGFYRYENGGVAANEDELARAMPPDRPRTETRPAARNAEPVTQELMGVMVEEARRCLAEGVVQSADEIDFALLSGAGFPAFRGGLLRWAATRVEG